MCCGWQTEGKNTLVMAADDQIIRSENQQGASILVLPLNRMIPIEYCKTIICRNEKVFVFLQNPKYSSSNNNVKHPLM